MPSIEDAVARRTAYGPTYREAVRRARADVDDEHEWVAYERVHATVVRGRRGRTPDETLEIARILARIGELEMHPGRAAFRTVL